MPILPENKHRYPAKTNNPERNTPGLSLLHHHTDLPTLVVNLKVIAKVIAIDMEAFTKQKGLN
jgi:hypothetical protein